MQDEVQQHSSSGVPRGLLIVFLALASWGVVIGLWQGLVFVLG
jgi:hypothetical protein